VHDPEVHDRRRPLMAKDVFGLLPPNVELVVGNVFGLSVERPAIDTDDATATMKHAHQAPSESAAYPRDENGALGAGVRGMVHGGYRRSFDASRPVVNAKTVC